MEPQIGPETTKVVAVVSAGNLPRDSVLPGAYAVKLTGN